MEPGRIVKYIGTLRLTRAVAVVVGICLLLSGSLPAEELIKKKDLDGDGLADQVLIYDVGGTILRLETDEDHDGYAERVQFYDGGRPSRVESDLDRDSKTDCIDFIENDQRVRQERFDQDGNLVQLSLFDDAGQVRIMEKDTTKDGRFDTCYRFAGGEILSSTRDTDGNGWVNIRTVYENRLPKKQEEYDNEDGLVERMLLFDEAGRLLKLFKEPYDGGGYKTVEFYEKGEIKSRHQDMNGDWEPDIIITFENRLPLEKKTDTDFDGRFDVRTRFSKGIMESREKDTDLDGQSDYFALFDDTGRLLKIREDTTRSGKIDRIRYFKAGEPWKLKMDKDENGCFDTVSYMEGSRIVKTLMDKNQDGKPDTRLFFNNHREKEKLISDSDFDGKPDLWQFYALGKLSAMEKDENGDTKPDLKAFFQKGRKVRLIKDRDHDGYFEIVQVYDDPAWSMVMTRDANQDRQWDVRSFYREGVLKKTELDEDFDGKPDCVKYFDASGRLTRIKESCWVKGRGKNTEKRTITWFYGPGEILARGEEDKNGDGRPEIWYLYGNGVLNRVEEDTNLDGKPDLWEAYDETQAVVKRRKDLDFDGLPDFVDILKETETDG